MYTNENIIGMLLILNKLFPKLPEKEANFILAEASDLPNLNGKFTVNSDTLEVYYEKNK